MAPEEEVLIEAFKHEVIYKVVLASEEEQKVFTQWLKAGRDYNLNTGKDKNFFVHWCNDDMVYNPDGTLPGDEVAFEENAPEPEDG